MKTECRRPTPTKTLCDLLQSLELSSRKYSMLPIVGQCLTIVCLLYFCYRYTTCLSLSITKRRDLAMNGQLWLLEPFRLYTTTMCAIGYS